MTDDTKTSFDHLDGFLGPPSDGKCAVCGVHVAEHKLTKQLGHRWTPKPPGCQFGRDGRHQFSQAGEGQPCSTCGRRDPRFWPEDWLPTHRISTEDALDKICNCEYVRENDPVPGWKSVTPCRGIGYYVDPEGNKRLSYFNPEAEHNWEEAQRRG